MEPLFFRSTRLSISGKFGFRRCPCSLFGKHEHAISDTTDSLAVPGRSGPWHGINPPLIFPAVFPLADSCGINSVTFVAPNGFVVSYSIHSSRISFRHVENLPFGKPYWWSASALSRYSGSRGDWQNLTVGRLLMVFSPLGQNTY